MSLAGRMCSLGLAVVCMTTMSDRRPGKWWTARGAPAPAGEGDRRLRGDGHGRQPGVASGRLDDAAPASARVAPVRHAIQDALLAEGPVLPDGSDRPEADGDDDRGFHGLVERGRLRGVPLDGRALPRLLRVPDLAVQSRAADPDSQLRRSVPRLASVALRARSRHAQGHEHHRRPERVGRDDRGMARGVLLPVRVAPAAAERAAEAGYALARELLPNGLRRREARGNGNGRRLARRSTSSRSSASSNSRRAERIASQRRTLRQSTASARGRTAAAFG